MMRTDQIIRQTLIEGDSNTICMQDETITSSSSNGLYDDREDMNVYSKFHLTPSYLQKPPTLAIVFDSFRIVGFSATFKLASLLSPIALSISS